VPKFDCPFSSLSSSRLRITRIVYRVPSRCRPNVSFWSKAPSFTWFFSCPTYRLRRGPRPPSFSLLSVLPRMIFPSTFPPIDRWEHDVCSYISPPNFFFLLQPSSSQLRFRPSRKSQRGVLALSGPFQCLSATSRGPSDLNIFHYRGNHVPFVENDLGFSPPNPRPFFFSSLPFAWPREKTFALACFDWRIFGSCVMPRLV